MRIEKMSHQKSKAKDIIVDSKKIKEIVFKAMNTMSQIVGATLGPGGNPVLIEREGLSPLVTKDGLTVAKSLGVANAEANIIIEAAKEICLNTAKDAGDGTTTAIVLANALVKSGHDFLVNNPKYNPQRVIDELMDAYNDVIVPLLKNISIPAETEDQLFEVAKISANGNKEIARAAVNAVMAAGDDGHVMIVESQGSETKVDTEDGFIITSGLKDLGQVGPVFINDKSGQQVKMDSGHVVLYDGTLNDLKVPGYIQNAVADEGGFTDGTPIIVMAHGFADVVLDKFAKTTKTGLMVVPIKVPRTGLPNGSSMFLHDMAAFTGGVVYDPGNIEEMNSEDFGSFESAKINMYESFIIGTGASSNEIEQRIIELKAIEKTAFSEMDKSFIRAAIAKLTGGVSTIHVGGTSDLEIREKKGRVEDAVEAVRSAIAEGIVSGGCSMHMRIAHELVRSPNKKDSWHILLNALRAPFERLINNCGENYSEILVDAYNQVENSQGIPNKIFDANNHEFVNPIEAGIMEPAKVVRVSILNALSVASLLTTLGGLVVAPRNANMEMQMELANQAFSNMMETVNE
jgi:chaperonin GroEL